jgi:hypothetical protein
VEKPFAEVRATFLAEPRALLVNHANAAYHEGEQLSMRLYPLTKHKHFGKRIVIDLGQPYERGTNRSLVRSCDRQADAVSAR